LQALTYKATLDVDLVKALNPVDCGDAEVIPDNADKRVPSVTLKVEYVGTSRKM
jgi:hypothetical protein